MICDKKDCTGCFACYNICPKNCISMEEDEYGNVYPKIDKTKCINCNLCKKICPQLKEQLEFNNPNKTYAAYNKDDKVRCASTSGGLATTFYTYIIKKHGIGYGLSNFENGECKFLRLKELEDIEKVKGSKYVHGYIKDIYKKVKADLENDKKVIFIGTPCQISGLKSFLLKDYEKLITIDIICHGVPSQKLLQEEIKSMNINPESISKISFRNNNINSYNITYHDRNNKIIAASPADNSYYYKGFLTGLFDRENCYSCRYAQIGRVSDITIGDFWGLGDDCKIKKDTAKGISVVLINTDKGQKLFDNCKEELLFEERDLQEAIAGNEQLRRPNQKNKNYNKFKKIYVKKGYINACKNTRSFKMKLKNNKIIYWIYIKVKKLVK